MNQVIKNCKQLNINIIKITLMFLDKGEPYLISLQAAVFILMQPADDE
jgi:hypothetical protein